MVNTFLVYSDFKESAQALDNRRLGKQRVEAYQILWLLRDLSHLAKVFSDPLPTTRDLWREWIRRLKKKYLQLPYRYFWMTDQYHSIPLDQLPSRPPARRKYEVLSDGVQIGNQLLPRSKVILPSDHLMLLGYVHHPAVLMWLGHQAALEEYLDIHIQEWIDRGYDNTLPRYPNRGACRPKWTTTTEHHQNHRAALLDKEITRQEPSWYQEKEDFIAAGPFSGYVWPVA